MAVKNKFFLFILLLCTRMMTSCAQDHDFVVTIKTNYGDMIAILYDETPKHKENFIKLAREKYYDSLLFHRVIEGFMLQGGDPESKHARPGQRLGNGGPGYTIAPEFNPALFHEKGALAAARLGDQVNPSKASSGSQFYIVQGKRFPENEIRIDQQKFGMALQKFFQDPKNQHHRDSLASFYQRGDQAGYEKYIFGLKDELENQLGIKVEKDVSPELVKAYTTSGGTPNLDGEYTVFGKVIKGLDVIDKIAALPKGPADRPEEDVRMTIEVQELPKKKIEKLYGYDYKK